MDLALNIYKTEILSRYNVKIETDGSTLKELWEQHSEINISILIKCICLQMDIMETIGVTFYAISMENIYECNGVFIMLGNTIKLKDDKFTFHSPPILDKKKYFHSPEFLRQKSIPCSFHKSVIYYSFGLIILYCLVGSPELINGEYCINDEPISHVVEKSKGKYYYFLKRCFATNPELLFI